MITQNYNDPYSMEMQQNDLYQSTLNKDAILETTPHYNDKRFEKEQTVFGSEPNNGQYGHKHLHYDYSDRLWQFDYNKAQKATEIANQGSAAPKSCRWYEAYLSAHFGRSVEIEHIIAGVNRSNGYP